MEAAAGIRAQRVRLGRFEQRASPTIVDNDLLKGQPYRFPDTSKLPTDPAELRRTVEGNRTEVTGFNLMDPEAKQLDTDATVSQLFNILDTDATVSQLFNILQEGGPMRPQLRAAIFNALAELPGIEVDTNATDFIGRDGYAISTQGIEYIFDPDTAEVLAQRSFVPRGSDGWKGLPAGATVRETAYLESAIVDSTDETTSADEVG